MAFGRPDPFSIKETDRILWHHRIGLFGAFVFITIAAAFMLKLEFTHEPIYMNTVLILFFWVVIGPTMALLSLIPGVFTYFGTIEIVYDPTIPQQVCPGCQHAGHLELYKQRSMFSRRQQMATMPNLIHCKSCGYQGRQSRTGGSSSSGGGGGAMATGTVVFAEATGARAAVPTSRNNLDDIDDPLERARAILQASQLAAPVRGQIKYVKVASTEDSTAQKEDHHVEMVEKEDKRDEPLNVV